MEKQYIKLLNAAKEAAENSYSPYSKFAVGAAVLTKKGKIYKGANIENASYSLTSCAERNALYNAVSDGAKDIAAVAVWTRRGETFPCGACRQVILELAANADVIVNKKSGGIIIINIADLLPCAFTK
ncbi:cytidine deaminase [Endomicrobium proavitum]|uniref:Cytidine deaminase n=1 Tax=Endomicrobium proavitum TaxID=1408281 RepID=A0A0G3WJG8_9BACT|nr:cytidine deaminase [Endomicrobium proavitum]AKL97639.1 Cytidine deaminase [Endomicrobium proavitum]